MHITKANLEALRQGFSARFQDAFSTTDTWADRLSTVIDSDSESEVYGFLDDQVEIKEWLGERRLQSLEESEYRLKNRDFEATISLDRNKVEDDKLGLFSTVTVPQLGRAAAKHHDHQLAGILNGNAPCFDGTNFFSTAHPLVGGGTYSNSYNLALAADGVAFNTVRTNMRTRLDPSGKVRDIGSQFLLVVPPQLERVARIIVESESAPFITDPGTPATSGVAPLTNVQRGFATVEVVPELDDANRWFLLAVGLPLRPLITQVRRAPEFVQLGAASEHAMMTNKLLYGVDFRSAYGVSLPFLAAASDPDGAMT